MISTYKRVISPAVLIKRLNLSTKPIAATDHPAPSTTDEIVQWLTTPTSTNPPQTRTRYTLTYKNSTPSITILRPSSQPTTHQLSTSHLTPIAKTLVTPTLLRSPQTLPPVVVEYSSPNIAKPLHMGHLRSTLTGSFIHNITSAAGHPTTSICFLGDYGRQFGLLHAGILSQLPPSTDFKTYVSSLTLQDLLQTYITSTKKSATDDSFLTYSLTLSASLEESFNSETQTDGKHLWTHTRNLTISHLKSTYSTLGIKFDVFEGESSYNRDSPHTAKALEILSSHNLTTRHPDNSLRLTLPNTPDMILLKQDNSSVYLLRDIACALHRHSKNPSHKFVYVVDSGQSSHFKNLFSVLKTLGIHKTTTPDPPFPSTHTHVPFGKVLGMSTRQGSFTLLSDVINQGTEIMHESRKKSPNARNTDDMSVSQNLAVCGLIVNALKVRRTKPYTFDWNEALKSKGDTGVSLQYTIARLSSLVTRVTGEQDVDLGTDKDKVTRITRILQCGRDDVMELLFAVMNYEDTFWKSYTTLEPCTLVCYSFNLADKISKVLSTIRIIDEPDTEFADAILWLLYSGKLALLNCMKIVGVKPVGEF